MYEHTRQKDFVCGALVGGAVALLTSLLFTTKKGKEIQHKIAATCGDIEDKVCDAFSNAKDKVKDKVEDGIDHLNQKVGNNK